MTLWPRGRSTSVRPGQSIILAGDQGLVAKRLVLADAIPGEWLTIMPGDDLIQALARSQTRPREFLR